MVLLLSLIHTEMSISLHCLSDDVLMQVGHQAQVEAGSEMTVKRPLFGPIQYTEALPNFYPMLHML